LVAGDVIHVDATLVRANVSLDSLVRRHIEEVLVANAEGALLSGPRHVKRRPHVVSTTDPDCAMATSSRRTFTEPSYKQHVAVDDQAGMIVDVVVTPGDVNEGNLIEQHVVKIEQLTGYPATTVTADAGYAYGKVYAALESRGIDPIIPAKAEPKPSGVIPLRRFKYDAKHQIVRCPAGKTLTRSSKTWHGWYYKSRTQDCHDCALRTRCLSPTVGRRAVVISDGMRRSCELEDDAIAGQRMSSGSMDGIAGVRRACTRRRSDGMALVERCGGVCRTSLFSRI
jgi:hypothetical protein